LAGRTEPGREIAAPCEKLRWHAACIERTVAEPHPWCSEVEMAAPMQNFNWYGANQDVLKSDVPTHNTLKGVLGLVFVVLAIGLIALSFWFEANG
jgi:hypothetical protein